MASTVMSAAVVSTLAARAMTSTAINQTIGPLRGPSSFMRMICAFLTKPRRDWRGNVARLLPGGRSSPCKRLSRHERWYRLTWKCRLKHCNFFPLSRRCATTSSGRWPRPVGWFHSHPLTKRRAGAFGHRPFAFLAAVPVTWLSRRTCLHASRTTAPKRYMSQSANWRRY